MSGGSHGYIYCKIEDELCGQMEDRELDDLIQDIADLAHDLEWYHSSDTCREDYLESVAKFKEKWFKSSREERLKSYIDEALDSMRAELFSLVGGDERCKQ